jgi:hypothetical protein
MVLTHNTIAYASLMETKRTNEAREYETHRANVVLEEEAKRSHLAAEQLQRASIAAQNYATAQNAANVAAQIAANRAMQTERLKQEYELTLLTTAARNPYAAAVTGGYVAGKSAYGLLKATDGNPDYLNANLNAWNDNKKRVTSSYGAMVSQASADVNGLPKFNAISNAVQNIPYSKF